MKLIITGGPPSVGKTSVLIHVIRHLDADRKKTIVIKLDCLTADDSDQYKRHGIRAVTGLSTYICPDHYLATNIERIIKYGIKVKTDYLIIESAGLCNRCSPHLQATLGITVLDMLSGIHAPKKVGPLLKSADVVVLTRGDMVSQAEREVFRVQISKLNRKAKLIEVNGLTGQNSFLLAGLFRKAPDFDPSIPLHLKFPLPGAVCSFCLGEQRVGETYASGNVKLLDLPGMSKKLKGKPI
jgi:Ni2+-binding GTPase involved in maturation of urease and hydrogenase